MFPDGGTTLASDQDETGIHYIKMEPARVKQLDRIERKLDRLIREVKLNGH